MLKQLRIELSKGKITDEIPGRIPEDSWCNLKKKKLLKMPERTIEETRKRTPTGISGGSFTKKS